MQSANGRPADKKLTPAQQRDMANFLTKAAGVFFGGDATTIGLGPGGDPANANAANANAANANAANAGAPAVYVVSQYAKDVDFAAALKGLVDDARRYDAAKPPADRSDITVETFAAADGSKVTRVRSKGTRPGALAVYLDAVQKGRTVLLAAGTSEAHAGIDRLLAAAAKPEGDMKAVAEGWVDLEGAIDAAMAAGGPSADLRKMLADTFKGQRLTWTAGASPGGRGLTVDVTAPPALVTIAGKLLARADAGPPAKPPTAKPPTAKPPAQAPAKPPARGGGL
jgi:hypothetical protein